MVSAKTGLWKEIEKTTLSKMFLSNFYKNKTEFKKPFKFTLFKCTKSSLHGFWKELKFLQRKILLGKGSDFSKSLELKHCWATKPYIYKAI